MAGKIAASSSIVATAAARRVADVIARVVDSPDDDEITREAAAEVEALCADYPLYDGDAAITDIE